MSERELINYGILKGWLKAIARVNDKTDNGHDFELWKVDNLTKMENVVERISALNKAKVQVMPIENSKKHLLEKVNFWFFNYQPNKFSAPKFLEDKRGDFSLYDNEYKEDWVKEFVNLLIDTTKMKNLFEVKLTEMKGYYCNMSDDLIIEGQENFYQLHFCLTD